MTDGRPSDARLTCHIHAGMHKTGTTAIQQSLSRGLPSDICYLPDGHPNFSGWFATLFEDEPWKHINNWLSHQTRSEVIDRRNTLTDTLSAQLDKAAIDDTITSVFFSGERMSAAKDDAAITRMRDYLSNWCNALRIYAYVRTPVSFMESSFLQSLNSRAPPRLDADRLWPKYRARLEKFDRVFGRDSVALIRYAPASFPDGDVVQDLMFRIGKTPAALTTPQGEKTKHNPSLSLEAAALLFAMRRSSAARHQSPVGVSLAMTLATALRPIGAKRMHFDPLFYADVFTRQADDLNWIETRLGTSLDETAAQNGISSEAQLLEIAAENRSLLLEMMPITLDNGTELSPRSLIDMVDEGLVTRAF